MRGGGGRREIRELFRPSRLEPRGRAPRGFHGHTVLTEEHGISLHGDHKRGTARAGHRDVRHGVEVRRARGVMMRGEGKTCMASDLIKKPTGLELLSTGTWGGEAGGAG